MQVSISREIAEHHVNLNFALNKDNAKQMIKLYKKIKSKINRFSLGNKLYHELDEIIEFWNNELN